MSHVSKNDVKRLDFLCANSMEEVRFVLNLNFLLGLILKRCTFRIC